MAKQTLGVGTVVNDGTGDNLRTAGIKINDNFTELYNALSAGGTTANSVVYEAVEQTVTGSKTFQSNKTTFGYTNTTNRIKQYDGLGGSDARLEITADDTTSNVTVEYTGSLFSGSLSAEQAVKIGGSEASGAFSGTSSSLNRFTGNSGLQIGVGSQYPDGVGELSGFSNSVSSSHSFSLYNKTQGNFFIVSNTGGQIILKHDPFEDSNSDGIFDNFTFDPQSTTTSNIFIKCNGDLETGKVEIFNGQGSFDGTVDFTAATNFSIPPKINVATNAAAVIDFESEGPNSLNSASGGAFQPKPMLKLFSSNDQRGGESTSPIATGKNGVADENLGSVVFHGRNNRTITGTITTGKDVITGEDITPFATTDTGDQIFYDTTKSWTKGDGARGSSVAINDIITITTGSATGAIAKVASVSNSGTQQQFHLTVSRPSDNTRGFEKDGVAAYPQVGDSYTISCGDEVFYGQVNAGVLDPTVGAQKGALDFHVADGSAASTAGISFNDANNNGVVLFPNGPILRVTSENIRVINDCALSIGTDFDIQIKHNSTTGANTIGTSSDTDLLQLSDNKVKVNGTSELVFDEAGSIRFNDGTSDTSTEFFKISKDSNGDVIFDDVVNSDNESGHEFFINTNRFRLRHTTDESTYTNMLSFDAASAVTISNALTVTKDTGISVTGNLTASGSVIGGVDTVSGDGSGTDAISLNTDVTFLNTSGGTSNLTLATGTDGQVKRIIMEVFDSAATLLLANGNLVASQVSTSIVFDAVGESATLVYSASLTKWIVVHSTGATIS